MEAELDSISGLCVEAIDCRSQDVRLFIGLSSSTRSAASGRNELKAENGWFSVLDTFAETRTEAAKWRRRKSAASACQLLKEL